MEIFKNEQPNHNFWLRWRQSLLNQIDMIECLLGIQPRTSEIRRWYKKQVEVREAVDVKLQT